MITTRSRLISAGLELIAERGYQGATVGAIEEAAGLVPRRGALYKHFANKEELIRAGLEERIAAVQGFDEIRELLPLDDRRSELTLIGRWVLRELKAEEQIARIIEKEGDRFPELRKLMLTQLVNPGFEMVATGLRATGVPTAKADAVAAVMLGALVNHQRHATMFGAPPFDVDQDPFVDAWVDIMMLATSPSHSDKGETA